MIRMAWVIGVLVACVALAWVVWSAGPRVPEERIADADLDLVREGDRARWRRQRLRKYRLWKRQDDFYRIAAYRKAVAGGLPEPEAKTRIRKDFPFYYLDPVSRDAEGYAGDDGALPIVLRERVEGNARVLKELMEEKDAGYRSMNALIRVCLRKGAF
jgi:hypothetical protein